MYNIQMDEEGVKTLWSALVNYRHDLQTDLKTRYNGNPYFSNEDRNFLECELVKVNKATRPLMKFGFIQAL